MKNSSATVVVLASSLFAWSVIRTILSPVLNVPAVMSISPAIAPPPSVCILEVEPSPLEFATIELIVPFAPVVCPVITFAAANPIEEFVALLFCDVTGLAKVALVFPVMSVIKIVATLLTVLDASLTIP